MSLLKLACVILAVASTARASIGPHYDLAPHLPFAPAPVAFAPAPLLPAQILPPPLLPPQVLPPPIFHSPPAPLFHAPPVPLFHAPPAPVFHAPPAPIFHAPPPPAAPLWPAPVFPPAAPLWPAPVSAPIIPAPLPLPSVFDTISFAPTYRAIAGPVTKTHHVSVGWAHPVPAKFISAPAPHVHPLKLIAQPSHAHIHAHSAPFTSLPHHHHHHHAIV